MDLSQLENIKQQINKLDNIIQTSSKKKQWSSYFPINWKVFEKLDYIATMVAGNIQERIKKMKEAILMEAKQRAHFTVQTASEEADQERAKFYNAEKEKIMLEFALLAKNEKIKDKMYFFFHSESDLL